MGLFDIFKKKRKEEIDFNGDIAKIINRGILFEDINILVKWGEAIKDIAKNVELKEKFFADRSVYNWGEHTILNGITLPLTTTYWNHREDSVYKIFNAINFSVSGNEEAKIYAGLIKAHLESEFGEAQHKEMTDTEEILEWVVNDTRLNLHFFEQYTNKLIFEINKC